ncbi:MAG: CBS domain-containing protein [Acidimicrobiia bacterium]
MSETVTDLMSHPVVTLAPDTPIADAADTMAERRFGALPVVDASGALVGLLRDDDLLVSETTLHAPAVISFFSAEIVWPSSARKYEEDLKKFVGATVREVMTTEFPTIASTASVEDLATLMHAEGATHIPVVDGEQLVGIVARGDLVRHLARTT